jgi:hypothetical protein
MLDTVRNPLLHRDRMTSLQSKSAAKDSDARKVLGDKYDAMDKAKNETYRELGTAMYPGSAQVEAMTMSGTPTSSLPGCSSMRARRTLDALTGEG